MLFHYFWQTISNSDEPVYNGQYWVVNKDGREFFLRTSPQEAANVSVDVSASLDSYRNEIVFVAAQTDVILQELGGVIGAYATRIQEACYGPCIELALPEKECSSTLIVWNASENNKVYQQDKCVFIEGTVAAADAFLYRLLGY